jgi:hypothetical protein
MARLSLRAEPGAAPPSLRLVLTAHDSAVRLDGGAWERLAPASRSDDTSFRSDADAADTVRVWFGAASLEAGEARTSMEVPLPPAEGVDAGWVIKVSATDRTGHRVTAWEEIAGSAADIKKGRP